MSVDEIKRVFFAFEVIAPWPDHFPPGRLLEKGDRHITVAFLGNIPYSALKNELEKIPKPPFKVAPIGKFDELLFLPENKPTVVAYKGSSFEKDLLSDYSQSLTTFLKNLGFKLNNHPFLNHTTLCRAPFNKEEWSAAFTPLPYAIVGFHLYESLGNLRYKPLWSYPLIPPFEEIEHIADIAFKVHGENVNQLYMNAQVALAFQCPELLPFLDSKTKVNSLDEGIIQLNKLISKGDEALGTPFKAVSFHGTLHEKEFLTWEMIVDV